MNTKFKDIDRVKWVAAGSLFNFWMVNDCPKAQNMTILYNEEYSTTYKRSYFKTIVKYFIEGLIPMEDVEWLSFKEQHEG